jgi:hypothetical protein
MLCAESSIRKKQSFTFRFAGIVACVPDVDASWDVVVHPEKKTMARERSRRAATGMRRWAFIACTMSLSHIKGFAEQWVVQGLR